MKHLFHYTVFLLLALSLSGGCTKEMFNRPGSDEDGEVALDIHFGSPAGATIDVSTKSALGLVRESNVFNLYLMIFDDAGKKVPLPALQYLRRSRNRLVRSECGMLFAD